MGIMRLCDGDPLLDSLRDLFDATPLRTPEERIQPLVLLSRRKKVAKFLGGIQHAIEGIGLPILQTGNVADLSGKQSRSVDAKLGIDVLSGFLAGFGVPATGVASIGTALSGAVTVKFSFGDVDRCYVDLVALGKEVAGRRLSATNAVLAPFLKESEGYDLVVIDSVLRSGSFTLSVDSAHAADFSINAPAIESAIKGTGSLNSVSTAERTVTFSGKQKLTFAFSCAQLRVGSDGQIVSLNPGAEVKSAGALPGSNLSTLRPRPFFPETGLLTWEE